MTRTYSTRLLWLMLLATFAIACQAAVLTPATPSPTSAGSPSPAATTALPSATASAQPSPTGGSLSYVAFGDSWPYGAHCDGCVPFPVLYAEGLASATSREVDFSNLVTN